jgi:hypothetical protein
MGGDLCRHNFCGVYDMRPGGGAHKGGAYERKLARALSTWWYGDPNYLWRRPGSGHRSNMPGRHTGDIVPIADSGSLPSPWIFHVEAKCFSKKRLKLATILWPKRNPIRKIWHKALSEKRADLVPLLILKSNNTDPVAVMKETDAAILLNQLKKEYRNMPTYSVLPHAFDTYVSIEDPGSDRLILFPWLEIQNLRKKTKKK